MNTCLTDLELIGHQFTWERGRGTAAWTEVRLDRALTTEDWLRLFPMAKLYNLEASSSDHSPLLLVPEVNNKFTAKRRFRFENAWLTDPMCRQLVWDSWESNVGGDIQDKIKLCGENLQQWGKEITGRFNARIKSCRLEMRRLRKFRDAGSVGKYKEAKKTLMLIM